MPKNKDNIKLSILILSIPSRFDIVRPLIDKLMTQIGDREDVEILSLMDNKSLHIWEKRNELMRIARGTHMTWLDDDDDVADNYVDKLTEAIDVNPNADVISFDQMCYLNGVEAKVFAKMGNPHENVLPDPTGTRYRDTLRPPYHWCCWKTSLALQRRSDRRSRTGIGDSPRRTLTGLQGYTRRFRRAFILRAISYMFTAGQIKQRSQSCDRTLYTSSLRTG